MAVRKQTIQAWVRRLQKRTEQVGQLRDKIRQEISDMEDLEGTCEEAYEDLQHAIDALSRLA